MESEMFMGLFDITKPESDVPICIVIDNCSIHTSYKTRKKVIEWEKEGIFLYYLPPRCPELNLIEGKWNKLKYHYMHKRNFDNQDDLESAIKQGITKMNIKT
jgi:transposase